jgi:hypothetical protein
MEKDLTHGSFFVPILHGSYYYAASSTTLGERSWQKASNVKTKKSKNPKRNPHPQSDHLTFRRVFGNFWLNLNFISLPKNVIPAQAGIQIVKNSLRSRSNKNVARYADFFLTGFPPSRDNQPLASLLA